MSHEVRIANIRSKFNDLAEEVHQLKLLRKTAFLAAPPMPQGGAPPMDPAMMQGGMPPGAPPMDPAMMGGAPPMDPAMMGGAPPVDPATGMPTDPAMMQGGAPPMDPAAAGGAPPIDPALIDQIVGLLEEIGQKVQQNSAMIEELKMGMSGEIQDLGEQVAMIEKRVVEGEAAAAAAPAAPPVGSSW